MEYAIVQNDSSSIVIEPRKGYVHVGWGELWAARELFYFLAWRDLKTRYAQTAIGAGWALIQPLLSTLIFTLVFSYLAKVPSDGLPYPLFAFAAILPWSLFARSLERSTLSVVTEGGLIKKVYFPRLIIPIAATLLIWLILRSACDPGRDDAVVSNCSAVDSSVPAVVRRACAYDGPVGQLVVVGSQCQIPGRGLSCPFDDAVVDVCVSRVVSRVSRAGVHEVLLWPKPYGGGD